MAQRIMTQAIQTKWLGPTNTRGSRVRAWCNARSLTIGWDHSLNIEGNHQAAAMAVAKLLGWDGEWFGGALPNEQGYAFVQPNLMEG